MDTYPCTHISTKNTSHPGAKIDRCITAYLKANQVVFSYEGAQPSMIKHVLDSFEYILLTS